MGPSPTDEAVLSNSRPEGCSFDREELAAPDPAPALAYALLPPACSATPSEASRHRYVRACHQAVPAAPATCPAPS